MLNLGVASGTTVDGKDAVEVDAGVRGNLLYGPYHTLPAGQYRVEYAVELRSGASAHDIAAIIDVVADYGQTPIALDYVSSARIGSGQPVALEFDLAEATQVEYRLSSTGLAHIAVADLPRVTVRRGPAPAKARFCRHGTDQLAGERGEPMQRLEDVLHASEGRPKQDGIGLGEQLAAALRQLRPQRVIGFNKVRVGGASDGGYVCLDDFDGVDTVLSFGIDHNVDFDDDMAARGAHLYQFDHTVDDPRPGDPRMTFEKKMISIQSGAGAETLPALIKRHDANRERPNILLKIDIEN